MVRDRLAFLVAVCAIISVWALGGCGGGSKSTSGGQGGIQVSLVDAPLAADEVNVDIKSVQVSKDDASWTTIKEFETPLHVNLLDYRTGGQSLMLADSPLNAGHYTMIRLMLTSAEVVVDGQSHEVDLRNVTQTGVKCNGEFDVQQDQKVALILDFNAGRSFVQTGNGRYMLHPVMTMSPVNIASEVTGKVAFKDGEGADLPVPTDLIVNIYAKGHAASDAPLASTVVESDGTFRFGVVIRGQYDLEVLQGNDTDGFTSIYSQSDITVTPPSTDLGTITITSTQAPTPPPAP